MVNLSREFLVFSPVSKDVNELFPVLVLLLGAVGELSLELDAEAALARTEQPDNRLQNYERSTTQQHTTGSSAI